MSDRTNAPRTVFLYWIIVLLSSTKLKNIWNATKLFLFQKAQKLRLFSQVFHFHLKFVWIKNSYWRISSLCCPKQYHHDTPLGYFPKLENVSRASSVKNDSTNPWTWQWYRWWGWSGWWCFSWFGQFVVMRWGQKTETDRHIYQGKHQ